MNQILEDSIWNNLVNFWKHSKDSGSSTTKKEIKTIVSLNDYKLAHGIEEKKL